MEKVDETVEILLTMDGERLKTTLLTAAQNPLAGIESLLVPALEKMGELWDNGEVALSQLYLAGKLCEETVEELLPKEGITTFRESPKIGLVVLEDYHMLGRRLVYSTLRAANYQVTDYGHQNVDECIAAVFEDEIEILLISVLMLPSALKVKNLSDRLRESRIPIYLIVGGAPFRFDPLLWKEVGADATAGTASETLSLVRNYCAKELAQ